MPFDVIGAIFLMIAFAIVWLSCSMVVMCEMSEIQPHMRHFTRWPAVRVLMLAGGPLTIMVVVIGGAVLGFIEVIRFFAWLVPEWIEDIFRPTPTRRPN